MRLRALVLPAAAVALGWWLLPTSTTAFTTTGDSLRLSQRHVRVHDNFLDPEANANTAPDLSFPGYVGAELAIWKACVEWGSELHFEGNGDPLQPGDLGSGGANFDASWQGLANGPGNLNQNVHSELGGNGLGTIAFTEIPTSNGWRIRYYAQPWIFYDNPVNGPNGNEHYDLQGVACHEYGHALGLGHSNDPDATMFPTSLLNATPWRSIEADDQLGVRFIYGTADPAKPHVAGTPTSPAATSRSRATTSRRPATRCGSPARSPPCWAIR